MDNEKSAVEIQVGHTYKGRDGHLRKVLSIDDNPDRTVTYELIKTSERSLLYYEAQLIFGTDLGESESNATKPKSSNRKQTLEEAFRWAKMDIDSREAGAAGREGDYWRGFISGLILAREFLNRVEYVSLGKGSYYDDDAWREGN